MEKENLRQQGIDMILKAAGLVEEDFMFAEKFLLLAKNLGAVNPISAGGRMYIARLESEISSERIKEEFEKLNLDKPRLYDDYESAVDIVFERRNNNGELMEYETMFRIRRGQTTVEYILLVTIILGAFLTMGHYFKRGIQGRWKAAVDDLGDQYDPRTTNSRVLHTILSNTDTSITSINVDGGSWTLRRDLINSLERKTGFISVGAY